VAPAGCAGADEAVSGRGGGAGFGEASSATGGVRLCGAPNAEGVERGAPRGSVGSGLSEADSKAREVEAAAW